MTNLGYCRMCAEIKQCFHLIVINKNETNTNDDANTNLIYKIFHCFQIKVLAEDNLPKTVCFDCCTQIDHIYEFYQKVQKAQEFLNNIVFNQTINDNFSCNYDDFHVENENNFKFIPKVEITEKTSFNTRGIVKRKISKKIVRKRTCIWTCNKCEIEFEIRKELDKHFQNVHNEIPEYKCPKCSKSFTVHYSYTRHLRIHRNQDKFRCFICNKSYSENNTLRKHLKLTHKQDLKKVCTACGIVYKRPQLLEQHIKKFHKPIPKRTRYECDICKKKVFNLLWHKKTHEAWKAYTWKCDKCQVVFQQNAELVQHCKEVHDESPEYKCPTCTRCLRKYRNFLAHLRVHRDKNKFSCNICAKVYSTKRGLRRHVYENHELNPLVKSKCSICEKAFKNPRLLQIHQKSFHTGIKLEVECDICHRKLASKASLYLHKKTHDESTKSHICNQCGAGYRQKCMLKYHIESAHTVLNEEDYLSCSICPAKFKDKRALRGHITRIHSEKRFECEMCGKKYYGRTQYTDHIRLHTGERPHQCEYCKKLFRLKRQLDVHMRQHTGEKPYHCAVCNHRFTNSGNYVKHKRRKHGLKNSKNNSRQRNTRVKSMKDVVETEQQQNEMNCTEQQQDGNVCMQRMLDMYPIVSNPVLVYPNMHGSY